MNERFNLTKNTFGTGYGEYYTTLILFFSETLIYILKIIENLLTSNHFSITRNVNLIFIFIPKVTVGKGDIHLNNVHLICSGRLQFP